MGGLLFLLRMAKTLIQRCVLANPSRLSKSTARIGRTQASASAKSSISARFEKFGFRERSTRSSRRDALSSSSDSAAVENEESMSIDVLRRFFDLNIGKCNSIQVGKCYRTSERSSLQAPMGRMTLSVSFKHEKAYYASRDPIMALKKYMLQQNLATEAELKAFEKKIDEVVEDSVEFADSSPHPHAVSEILL